MNCSKATAANRRCSPRWRLNSHAPADAATSPLQAPAGQRSLGLRRGGHRLVDRGEDAVGGGGFDADDPSARLRGRPGFSLVRGDILDGPLLCELARGADLVVHLAALAGVRPSLAEPRRPPTPPLAPWIRKVFRGEAFAVSITICHAVRAGIGMEAETTKLSERGFRTRSFRGTTAYSAKAPPWRHRLATRL